MGSAEKLAFYLLKKVNKAVRDHGLIEDGDQIVVAVCGGKDSLSLLKLLDVRQPLVRESYHLLAVHVQSDLDRGGHFRRPELERLFQGEGVEYSFEEMSLALEEDGSGELNCFWCSWNRRKALFLAADRLGCNKVAFGHHADDVARTTLLNLLYHGRLETMEPKVSFFGGKITVIRPLAYVPEKELVRFARACGFPGMGAPCPNSVTSKRATMKDLLRAIEKECPQVKTNLFRAVQEYRGRLTD